MTEEVNARQRRPRYVMPAYISDVLASRGLTQKYRERPPYQQNDYIGWITRAKKDETRQKRLSQMLDELERGDAYMKMPYRAKRATDQK